VAIKDWGITVRNLTGVIHDDDLSFEVSAALGGVVFGIGSYESTLEFLDRNVLYVKADVVTWGCLGKSFVVHFYRLDFSG
jgi:hypothetical protein